MVEQMAAQLVQQTVVKMVTWMELNLGHQKVMKLDHLMAVMMAVMMAVLMVVLMVFPMVVQKVVLKVALKDDPMVVQ